MVGALGAEWEAADLAATDPAGLLDALDRYQLLVLRDLRLEPDSLTKFAARLGALDTYPFADAIEGFPHVVRLVKEPGDLSNFGGAWHTDTSYQREPPAITLLYAVETPDNGGDTLFADMYGVFERLSEGFRAQLRRLTGHNTASLVHDARGDYATVTGQSVSLKEPERETEADHPLVIRHHRTGREAVFFSLIHTERLVGFSRPESLVVLQQLHELATEASNITRLRWSPGTLAIWDNRAVQHYPLNDYPGQRREMHRVILKGDRPSR
jgi:taurine dioxygenase